MEQSKSTDSAQIHTSARSPTPPGVATPPPTADASGKTRAVGDTEQELRAQIRDLEAALKVAKTAAAHHKLQYNMLVQESAAAMERMAVEARMEQYENEMIHRAAAAAPVEFPEGMIPVQRDLYQQMCEEIRTLRRVCGSLERERDHRGRTIARQETEIASLTERVTLMRERIRDRGLKGRSRAGTEADRPFAALLQASEMVSRRMAGRRGHTRGIHSMSSLPSTPARVYRPFVPATAPARPRHDEASEDTVSNSDGESEAETDILEGSRVRQARR
ncbi:hypothetical protein K470DRAFT_267788 [Piedraia hortae CBS 480.64]|uniref:Uncharacterized protein n=1 Tax=Piedraia hortae CBS 480.64 TaxID=1314780 RepID=A0A6A7C858_9PEZI|nr:hypothetical protein K470DRAFT_267788 [Piedraia hortae CBS 480.64]